MLLRRAGLTASAGLSCCIYVSSLYVLWVANIVDLRVFWQPGSVLFVLYCRDYSLFGSNKFLLLLLPVHRPIRPIPCPLIKLQ